MPKKFFLIGLLLLMFMGKGLCLAAGRQQAPPFVLPDLQGNLVSTESFLGKKPALLMFWATWCSSCRREFPGLIALNRQYGEKMRFLAINIAVGDSLKNIRSFMKKAGGGVTVLYDEENEVAASYKVFATPHIVLIDKKGDIFSVAHELSIEDIRILLGEGDDS